jgi:simple sugar transport system permease protein
VASFLLAGLRVGVEGIQLDLQVPAAFGGVMEGLILLTILAGSFFQHYTISSNLSRANSQDSQGRENK